VCIPVCHCSKHYSSYQQPQHIDRRAQAVQTCLLTHQIPLHEETHKTLILLHEKSLLVYFLFVLGVFLALVSSLQIYSYICNLEEEKGHVMCIGCIYFPDACNDKFMGSIPRESKN